MEKKAGLEVQCRRQGNNGFGGSLINLFPRDGNVELTLA